MGRTGHMGRIWLMVLLLALVSGCATGERMSNPVPLPAVEYVP